MPIVSSPSWPLARSARRRFSGHGERSQRSLCPRLDLPRHAVRRHVTLYALVDAQGNARAKDAGVEVSWREHDRHQAIDQEAAANQRMREAEGDGSKGLLSSITDTLSDALGNLATLDFEGLVEDSVNDTVDTWNSPQFWKDLEVGAGYVAEAALVAGTAVATCGAAAPVVAGIAIGLSAGASPSKRRNASMCCWARAPLGGSAWAWS